MKEKLNTKNILIIILLIGIALVSMLWISKIASSIEFHEETIKHLDEKKLTVMELTAATAGSATAIAAIPSDATTPLANQIMDMSSYLIIVIGVIFLEKILLTLTGKLTFLIIIPIACLLYAIYIFAQKEVLRNLAIKLAIFGIVIFAIVPISVKLSDFIEENYGTSITQTIESAKALENNEEVVKQEEQKEENWWNKITSSVSNAVSNIGEGVNELIEKGKLILSNFIDAIAILIITTCVIPIMVLFVLTWVIKIIFDITIPVKTIKPNLPKFKNKTSEE
ncbi:MAG: hypothetical protein IJW20_05065 [Clostridia bacterium]|nr:hypothetical protein [Clostridia bacterium]